MGYAKLFSSIIHSTIWREADHVRIVWVTMLAMSDENGIVETSVPGLADAARVNLQECIEALNRLQAPDEYSRCPDNEGRRLEKIDGGFEILNYEKYRRKASEEEKRERNAEKQKRWRERQKAVTNSNQLLPPVTGSNPPLPVVTEITEITPSDQIRSDQIRSDQIRSEQLLLLKRDSTSKNDIENVTKKYIGIFNAVFDRKGQPVKVLFPIVAKRLKEDLPVWQIYAAPILLSISSVNKGLFSRPNLSDILLRDGSHMVRGPNGPSPGINWIRDLILGIDTAVLDQKSVMIAQHFGIFDDLKNKVKSYWRVE